ncbi:MAG: amidohydrolase family protein [Haliscomenobacter sp.]
MKSLVLFLASLSWVLASAQVTAPEIAIIHVHVLPMTGKKVLHDQTVLIRSSVIYKIGPSARIKPIENALVIDGTGKYLMPGISEMHAHIPLPDERNNELVRETMLLYLSQGVTLIRGMLGDPFHLTLQDQVSTGQLLGPRIYTASPSLSGATARTPEEAVQKVWQYKKDNYDFLKIHPGISLATMEAIVRTAKEAGMPFAGHVPQEVGIHRALEMGYASIDHLDGYVEGLAPSAATPAAGSWFGYNQVNEVNAKKIPALVKATRKSGTWIVPTESLLEQWYSPLSGLELVNLPEMRYMPAGTRLKWRTFKQQLNTTPGYNRDTAAAFIALRRQILRAMEKKKVNLLLGSDSPQVGQVPGFSIHREMQALAAAGLSNYSILRSGTANPARFFGKEGTYGTVVPLATADLLLLDANPMDDIKNMQRIAGVLVQGRWMSAPWLAQRLAIIEARHAEN